jgi:hypothetical protein
MRCLKSQAGRPTLTFFVKVGTATLAKKARVGHPKFLGKRNHHCDNRRNYSRTRPPVRLDMRSIPCSVHQSRNSSTIFSVAQGSQ